MGENFTSPVPKKAEKKLLSFPEAMREIISGKKVTRVEWNNDDYCLLEGPWLSIMRSGHIRQWLVNDGDMMAIDWTVIVVEKEPN